MTPIRLAAIEATAYRVPIETPVRTSFGIMRDRPAVLVRAVDDDGAEGWGEVWCNFPSVGAEHRARLVAEVVAPQVELKLARPVAQVGKDRLALMPPADDPPDDGDRLRVVTTRR